MSAANPRYYKWYPTVSCDLGTMPFEGDFTTDDRIIQNSNGVANIYIYNASTNEFGKYVTERDARGRIHNVWHAGVTVEPVTYEGTSMPVWFCYCGDGVCVAKLPNGEEVEPVET